MMMTTFFKIKKLITVSCVIIFTHQLQGQITQGKILYERKVNLWKKFPDENIKQWIKESDKIKIENFELYFNDSQSIFKVVESPIQDPMAWATTKNLVYQNSASNYRVTVKNVWGENFYIEDSLRKRTWKITDSKRKIAGYNCRKAIWYADDTTRIYAWYCEEIIPPVGPESFTGLPGAILGLATEDGSVVYFAKKIEAYKPDMESLIPKLGKKVFTTLELKTKLEKDFGKHPYYKMMVRELFELW
jgi:GLPGLI family protein